MRYDGMQHWLRARLARRPWWMNLLMIFCAVLAGAQIPLDLLLTPLARDEQVWFGVMLTGWGAKLGALAHLVVYAAGAYGFWHMRTWMWPWASVYAAQIGFAMVVWTAVHRSGARAAFGIVVGLLFYGLITRALWRARPLFQSPHVPLATRYGGWAVVTGASSGIGAEFARAVARDGLSVVLTARRGDRLRDLARELEQAHGVATRVVEADLTAVADCARLAGAVADLDVSMVIANAGSGVAGRFDAADPDRLVAMVQLNCTAPVAVISRLLPRLQRRGRGAVILTGSTAAFQPLPFQAVYAATKAFDLYLGEALWGELQGSGVDVLVLSPGPVETEFAEVAGSVLPKSDTPAYVVAVAMNALGHQASVIPGWFNWLRAGSIRFTPRPIATLAAGKVMTKWMPR
jgi:short-subunit dehydrogenase